MNKIINSKIKKYWDLGKESKKPLQTELHAEIKQWLKIEYEQKLALKPKLKSNRELERSQG